MSAQRLSRAGRHAQLVRELSFDFAPGEFTAILGRNGIGKTLTLHTLARLAPAADGTVRIDGVPLRSHGPTRRRARIGLLTQDLEECVRHYRARSPC